MNQTAFEDPEKYFALLIATQIYGSAVFKALAYYLEAGFTYQPRNFSERSYEYPISHRKFLDVHHSRTDLKWSATASNKRFIDPSS